MCSCNTITVVTDYYTEICTGCGIESSIHLTQEPIYMPCATIDRSYSRIDRWKGLVRKITGYNNGPSVTDPIWEYLKELSPYDHPQDILKSLRRSSLTNKHYQSLYMFTKVFAPKYELPDIQEEVAQKLSSYFNFVYRMWNKYEGGNKPFFSYNWLVEQSLHFYNYGMYLPFIKRLVCKKRRRKYETILLKLYGTQLGMMNYKPQIDHLRCERSNSLIRRNRLCALCCLEFEVERPHVQDSQLCPGCKSIALRDVVRTCSS